MPAENDRRPHALSLDIDGVWVDRPGFQLGAMAKWTFHPWSYNRPFNPGLRITRADRITRDEPLGSGERRDLERHKGRRVLTEYTHALLGLAELGGYDAVFINSGRPNNKPYFELTMAQVEEAGLAGRIRGVYLKPEGRTSIQTKYWALKEIEEMGYDFDHEDDDAFTIKQLAPHFGPSSFFSLKHDYSSWFLLSPGAVLKHNRTVRQDRPEGSIILAYD